MYICSNCGFQSALPSKFCKVCGEAGTLQEKKETREEEIKKKIGPLPKKYNPQDRSSFKFERFLFEDSTLNELFGGGLVKGSVNFLSAEPGAGKSTFLGQIGKLLQDKNIKILYYSGEENPNQVYNRLERIYGKNNKLINNISLYYGEDYETFLGLVEKESPDIVIFDSLNTIVGESYTAQVTALDEITKFLKGKNITGFIIGHINKTGEVAGKKTLEHIVDGVFMISGKDDRTDSIRILKALKLRFGNVNNIVLMKMEQDGFHIQNPKDSFKLFVEESSDSAGSVLCPVLEGNQLLLIEIQSLLEDQAYSYPQKVGLGINKQKLDIIMATLHKSLKISDLKEKDLFVKVLSPFQFKNIHLDLAVACSIISSFFNINFKEYIFIGELGLSGEIRSIPKQKEIKERLIKMGFKEEYIIDRTKASNLPILLREVLKIGASK